MRHFSNFAFSWWLCLRKTIFIWVYVAVHIYTLSTYPSANDNDTIYGYYWINGLLFLLTFPSLLIFVNHLIYSIGVKVSFTGRQVVFEQFGNIQTLRIEKVKLVTAKSSRFPWQNHSFMVLFDRQKNMVILSGYVITHMELIQAMGSTADRIELEYELSYLPLIQTKSFTIR